MNIKIIFYGRGGQGAKSSADMFAKSAILQDYYAQSSSKFGAEKSGTPVLSQLKLSDAQIHSAEPIEKCDILVILDDTLIVFNPNIVKMIDEDSKTKIILLNTTNKKTIDDLNEQEYCKKIKANIITIDATGIALKHLKSNHPNTALLAKLYRILNDKGYNFDIKQLYKVIEEIFEEKQYAIQLNINTIEEAYNS